MGARRAWPACGSGNPRHPWRCATFGCRGRAFGCAQERAADRIRGGLAGLGLLMRLADAESGRDLSRQKRPDANSLRALFAAADMPRFIAAMERLAQAYPFDVSPFRILRRKPRALARARTLHAQLCAGCHDGAGGEGERPAIDLFAMAMALSREEFLARMVVGVRGDRTTGLGNPLTDGEIAALRAFYRAGPAATGQ